ncbi:MAG TPA: stress response translation initiation inhibitor YciH [Thermoanaerobaculia bacterium]|nr:stress response translation initiation inhibitor YciH [Thermoanaerobaculia bacterium]
MKSKTGKTVYSTESAKAPVREACRRCGTDPCRCEPRRSLPPSAQPVRVRRESGGRGGKLVTMAGPLVLVREEAAALLATWKKLLGTGGALTAVVARNGSPAFELEVQGDHADRILAELVKAGYPAKRSGG